MRADGLLALPGLPALVACVAWLGWPSQARASGSPLGDCWACALWLPVGVNVGAGIHPNQGTGFLIGGEASLIELRKERRTHPALGGYLDFLHDSESGTWRFSVGPETVVCPFVGFDAGLVMDVGGQAPRAGVRLRYFAPSLVVTPYFGAAFMFSGENSVALETGALLKFPIPLAS